MLQGKSSKDSRRVPASMSGSLKSFKYISSVSLNLKVSVAWPQRNHGFPTGIFVDTYRQCGIGVGLPDSNAITLI